VTRRLTPAQEATLRALAEKGGAVPARLGMFTAGHGGQLVSREMLGELWHAGVIGFDLGPGAYVVSDSGRAYLAVHEAREAGEE
jgi:hypothetical protein